MANEKREQSVESDSDEELTGHIGADEADLLYDEEMDELDQVRFRPRTRDFENRSNFP